MVKCQKDIVLPDPPESVVLHSSMVQNVDSNMSSRVTSYFIRSWM